MAWTTELMPYAAYRKFSVCVNVFDQGCYEEPNLFTNIFTKLGQMRVQGMLGPEGVLRAMVQVM